MRISDLITPEYRARYDRNQKRGIEACDLCGKPLKNRDRFIVEDRDGYLVPTGQEYDESGASTHAVGADCARKLRGFVWTF